MASCSAALKQSWIWPLWIWRLYNTKKCQGLCYRHVTLSQCYGQLITTFSLIFMGAGLDTKSENPPKKIVLNEVQPVSLNIIHPWVFPICWFWPINCLFVYFYLVLFALFAYLWLPLRKKKKKAGRYSSATGGCGTVHMVMTLSTGFFSDIQQRFAVPAQNVRMMSVSQRHFPSVAELWYETSWFSHERGVNPWKCYFSNVLFEKS